MFRECLLTMRLRLQSALAKTPRINTVFVACAALGGLHCGAIFDDALVADDAIAEQSETDSADAAAQPVSGVASAEAHKPAEAPPTSPQNDVPRQNEETQGPQVTAKIKRWVRELDAPQFAVRQQATEKLAASGAAAIPELVRAAQEGATLEVAARAVQILKTMYLSGDPDAFAAADTALQELARSNNRPVAATAARVLERYGDQVRLIRTVSEIQRLGGVVKFAPSPLGITDPSGLPIVQYVLLRQDWKGGDAGLKHIANLPTVGVLYLIRGIPVSDEALKQLQQQRPDLRIQYRGRAYLGIAGGTTPGEGCLISQVQPGGAAAKADLRAGDLILKFAGTPVTDFDQLVGLIGKHNPGDKVDVLIRRGGVDMTVQVVLQEWK